MVWVMTMAMATATTIENVATAIVLPCAAHHMDGIVLDIEMMGDEAAPSFSR
jgi:hypothetical protein